MLDALKKFRPDASRLHRVLAASSLGLGLFACAGTPRVVDQAQSRYIVYSLPERNFVYLEYHWSGGGFDDATQLEREFVAWGHERGIVETSIGRFPTIRDWQLGFTSVSPADPDFPNEFQGYAIHRTTLPAGEYAELRLQGHPERMFRFWRKFSRWLRRDGRTPQDPVIEVYPALDNTRADPEVGLLRYRVD